MDEDAPLSNQVPNEGDFVKKDKYFTLRKWLLFSGVSVVILFSVFGGYILIQNSQINNTSSQMSITPTPSSTQYLPSPTPTVIYTVTLRPSVVFVSQPSTDSDFTAITVSGTITEIDMSCKYDGKCRVKVDNKWIITDFGGDPSPEMISTRGPRGLMYDADGRQIFMISTEHIGKNAEVFVRKHADGSLSLYGSKEFFIKIK